MAAYYTDGETLNNPENLLLDETRQQLRIIGNEQDSQLLGYLRLAIELIERYIWRNLFERLVTARYSVRHRIDGLEIAWVAALFWLTVRHRIDGLESHWQIVKPLVLVRHRIDGLENAALRLQAKTTVRHRIDGLEIALD